MQIRKRNSLGILFFLLLVVASTASFIAPRSHALEANPDNGNQQRATRSASHRSDKGSAEVTSSDRRTSSVIACKQSCEEKYDNCVAAWVAKGRDRETGETRCGLGARSCKGRCDKNR
jgi:hypothetical protein